jgi:hypothetical protein
MIGTPRCIAPSVSDVARKIGDQEFIIPLRLAPFEVPLLIAHAQYIDFQRGWVAGLAELLEVLDGTYITRFRG